MKQKKIPLSLQIFLALGLGIAVGMAFTGNPTFAVSYIKPFGTIFLNLLKFVLWSREAPPCHITMVGSHHPLREPDLHLSMYPALLSFGQQLLTGCGLQHGIFCTQPAFYAVLQSLQPPMPACP